MGVCGGNELLSVLCYSNAGMNDFSLEKVVTFRYAFKKSLLFERNSHGNGHTRPNETYCAREHVACLHILEGIAQIHQNRAKQRRERCGAHTARR